MSEGDYYTVSQAAPPPNFVRLPKGALWVPWLSMEPVEGIRTHVMFKYRDLYGEVLYDFLVEPPGGLSALPAKGDLVTLPVDYDEDRLHEYAVQERHYAYSDWPGQAGSTTQLITIIVT